MVELAYGKYFNKKPVADMISGTKKVITPVRHWRIDEPEALHDEIWTWLEAQTDLSRDMPLPTIREEAIKFHGREEIKRLCKNIERAAQLCARNEFGHGK
jgi:hypothetical protein